MNIKMQESATFRTTTMSDGWLSELLSLSADKKVYVIRILSESLARSHSGKSFGADCIVTRDARHFADSQLPVYSPKEFLSHFQED